MKLKVTGQLHVSSVSSDTLRPGQEIEVGDALGDELLAKHPACFAEIKVKEKAAGKPANKKAAEPDNKAQG